MSYAVKYWKLLSLGSDDWFKVKRWLNQKSRFVHEHSQQLFSRWYEISLNSGSIGTTHAYVSLPQNKANMYRVLFVCAQMENWRTGGRNKAFIQAENLCCIKPWENVSYINYRISILFRVASKIKVYLMTCNMNFYRYLINGAKPQWQCTRGQYLADADFLMCQKEETILSGPKEGFIHTFIQAETLPRILQTHLHLSFPHLRCLWRGVMQPSINFSLTAAELLAGSR